MRLLTHAFPHLRAHSLTHVPTHSCRCPLICAVTHSSVCAFIHPSVTHRRAVADMSATRTSHEQITSYNCLRGSLSSCEGGPGGRASQQHTTTAAIPLSPPVLASFSAFGGGFCQQIELSGLSSCPPRYEGQAGTWQYGHPSS